MSRLSRFGLVALLVIALCTLLWWVGPRGEADGPAPEAVAAHYADMAHAVYGDSLAAARTLRERVRTFLDEPGPESLHAAREAWRAARVPYMQSEVFRFGNPPVDAWEGQVNAWPLDEGLIDYVAPGYVHEQGNPAARANLVASREIQVGGETVDVSSLTPDLLARLNEIGGSEANVATGYHAVEFLLWGQDLNGTGPGAGERPYTDYVAEAGVCTDGEREAPVAHCRRRAEYLRAAMNLLVRDLEYMTGQWAPAEGDNYRAEFLALPAEEALRRILFGMGSLALGELAGERMRVALIANSTEDEHDCFSDNTHASHYYNFVGIRNVYRGQYRGIEGNELTGPAIAGMLRARSAETAASVDGAMADAAERLRAIYEAGREGERFDQMIAPGNQAGNQRIRAAIDALVGVAEATQRAAQELGLGELRPETAGHPF